jgi:hypothetical protein
MLCVGTRKLADRVRKERHARRMLAFVQKARSKRCSKLIAHVLARVLGASGAMLLLGHPARAETNACYAAAVAKKTEAAKLCSAMASHGDAIAQGILGYLYDVGQSVPQDDTQAARWYGPHNKKGNEPMKIVKTIAIALATTTMLTSAPAFAAGLGVATNRDRELCHNVKLGFDPMRISSCIMVAADDEAWAEYEVGKWEWEEGRYDDAIRSFEEAAAKNYAPALQALNKIPKHQPVAATYVPGVGYAITGTVNGHDTQFVVDTGAASTTLNSSLFTIANPTRAGTATFVLADGSQVERTVYSVPSICVADMCAQDVRVTFENSVSLLGTNFLNVIPGSVTVSSRALTFNRP